MASIQFGYSLLVTNSPIMAVSHSQAPEPFLLVGLGVLTTASSPEYDVSLRVAAQALISMTSRK